MLSGQLLELNSLRYTPAGVPVIEFRLAHRSEQQEVGQERQVECEMPCVALGPPAMLLKSVAVGVLLRVEGFLAARSLKRPSVVLHVSHVEFLEN